MRLQLTAHKKPDSYVWDTYFFLRLSLGIIAILLPFVLWLGGRMMLGIPPQTSISAYYHTEMRDVFVGGLFAVGLALLIYKGFSFAEDWLLNAAGVLIICVAYFPMDSATLFQCFPPCETPCTLYSSILDRTPDILIKIGIHGYCAVAFFIAIGCVCIFCSTRTLHLIPSKLIRKVYLFTYRAFGIAMVVLPLSTAALLRLSPQAGSDCADRTVFWVESIGVWIFAVFWLIKTYEGDKYGADKNYLDRRSIPKDLARSV